MIEPSAVSASAANATTSSAGEEDVDTATKVTRFSLERAHARTIVAEDEDELLDVAVALTTTRTTARWRRLAFAAPAAVVSVEKGHASWLDTKAGMPELRSEYTDVVPVSADEVSAIRLSSPCAAEAESGSTNADEVA